ncbi:MAG: hypothetical protein AAB693_02010 [Patescibacteria group bacterium]
MLLEAIFFMVVVLPFMILNEAWGKFSTWMDKNKSQLNATGFWWNLPYFLIGILSVLILILI